MCVRQTHWKVVNLAVGNPVYEKLVDPSYYYLLPHTMNSYLNASVCQGVEIDGMTEVRAVTQTAYHLIPQ